MLKRILLVGVGVVGGLIVLVILLAIFAGDGDSVDNRPPPSITDPSGVLVNPPAPLMEVTVIEVYREYKQNEARANHTYKDQVLRVSFQVDEVEDDHVVQELEHGDEANLKFSLEELLKFNKGDAGQAQCELEGFQFDFLLEFDCR